MKQAVSLLSALVFLVTVPGLVSAVDFANLTLGLEAKTIIEQQHKKLFPDSKHGYGMECVRGDPKPWFGAKTKSKKSNHYTNISSTEALEALVTRDGDTLTIFNGGCEYYVIALRYEFSEKAHDKKDRRWWFGKAAKSLLRAYELGADSVFDLKKSAQTINRIANDKMVVKEIAEVPVEGDGSDFLQTRISITNYGQLPQESGSFVELELFKGPL